MPEDRRLAAIMFTDIVGYTKLMGSDEEKAVDMLSRNRSIHQSCIEKFNGTLIKEIGDGILASFSLASEAVRCAMEIQKGSRDKGIPLKIGIHEGEMIFSGSDVIGDGVNIASRIQEEAQAGCIHISASVYNNIRNKADIQTRLIGEKFFKNVVIPIIVYRVLNIGEELEEQSAKVQTVKKPASKFLYYILTGLIVVIIAILLIWKFIPSKKTIELTKSLAVLPFDYLGEDQAKQYQADGVMTAIYNHLSKIKVLKVIGRTSTERYRDTMSDSREIGKDLNVSFLLEGNFQMHGNNARLNVGLISTIDGSNIWSNEYEREWKDIFNIQSEVAKEIANEIEVIISPEEKQTIETIPTSNLEAYDFYLQGEEYWNRSNQEHDVRSSIQMYQKAIEIDPKFTLAWVGLAARSRTIYFWYNSSDAQREITKQYLDNAIALSADSKEVRFEEGRYYYQCERNYSKALRILEPLNIEYPNDSEIYFWIGLVYRRMGKLHKSIEYNMKAITLNPSNWRYWYNAGITYQEIRDFRGAEKCLYNSIKINPNPTYSSHYNLLMLYINTGQLKKARDYLQVNQRINDNPTIILRQAYIEILDRNFENAIQIIESLSEEEISGQDYYHTKHLQLGMIYLIISDKENAVKHFESEKSFLLGEMDQFKNDSRLYRSLGIAYAGLGMKKEAIEQGEKALDILSFSNDAISGYNSEMDMVKILLMVGEYDEALTRLDHILNHTNLITVEVVKLDPFWDPVREMDKFKEIISNPKYQIDISEN